VAAPKKITLEDEAEILRRRAAGEGIQSIAADFGIAHQTVSKLAKRVAQERSAELERQRRSESDRRGQPLQAPALQTDERSAGQRFLPAVFRSWEERFSYYERRRLESEIDYLNFNDVLRGRETPAERRARETRTPLSLR
jgi:hypothetical protein